MRLASRPAAAAAAAGAVAWAWELFTEVWGLQKDRLWATYNLGEVFEAKDHLTKAPALRNPFWKPNPGDFKVPGIGKIFFEVD